jgi:hypothetical protein
MAAWEAFILRTRALHRRAGTVAPQPTMTPGGLNGTDHGVPLPEFENIPQPRPELGPLLEICRLIAEECPADLLERKRVLTEEFTRQLGSHPNGVPKVIGPGGSSC